QLIDVAEQLKNHQITYKVPWNLSSNVRQSIVAASERGETSRQIGIRLGKDASYIRHVRSKMGRGRAQDERTGGPVIEAGTLRFPNEHRPGIPLSIQLNESMARLLGLYCAEGSVCSDKARPNSHTLNFSFSHTEPHLVEETIHLLEECLGVKA